MVNLAYGRDISIFRRPTSARKQVDEYDADYDRGRTKKVRQKDAPGGGISSASFQGAWSDRQRQHSDPPPPPPPPPHTHTLTHLDPAFLRECECFNSVIQVNARNLK